MVGIRTEMVMFSLSEVCGGESRTLTAGNTSSSYVQGA